MAFTVTLNALGRSYSIPEVGETNWRNQTSEYLRDTATVINDTSGGSLVTPVFNVKTYGATGNGTTDDTAAIGLAMTALAATGTTGGTLYFPAGTYKISSTLQFGVAVTQGNVGITGDGASSILLQFGAFSTTPLVEFRNCLYWSVANVVLDGTNATGSTSLLLIDGSSNGIAAGGTYQHAKAYGIVVGRINGATQPVNNIVTNNIFTSNASGNTHNTSTAANRINNNSGAFPGAAWYNVVEYGADPTGTVDCTSIVQGLFSTVGNVNTGAGNVVYFPAGTYKLGPVVVPGSLGFTVQGDGPYVTQLNWHGSVGGNFLTINSSQGVIVKNLTLNAPQGSNRPGKMLFFSYSPVVHAATANRIESVWITADGADGVGKYDYGIYWSDAYGNNSEMYYDQVTIANFALNGVTLPGTQQLSHVFMSCSINGGWDGVTFGVNGGQYGVMCGQGVVNPGVGGSFQWYGGGVSGCSKAAFGFEYRAIPCRIESCGSEEIYRFIDTSPTNTPATAVCPLIVESCRMSYGSATGAAGSMVRICDDGAYVFTGNQFEGPSGQRAQIEINSGGYCDIDVKDNFFSWTNSVADGPFNITGVFEPQGALYGNTYVDGSDGNVRRCEPLNVAPLAGAAASTQNNGEYWLSINTATFTAAALTQSVAVLTIPRGAAITRATAYAPQVVLGLAGTPVITATVGLSSGGNELMLSQPVNSTVERMYGELDSEQGAALAVAPDSGFVPDFQADKTVYLTLTSASGNLGTGSVTNLTGGLLLVLNVAKRQRWVHGA